MITSAPSQVNNAIQTSATHFSHANTTQLIIKPFWVEREIVIFTERIIFTERNSYFYSCLKAVSALYHDFIHACMYKGCNYLLHTSVCLPCCNENHPIYQGMTNNVFTSRNFLHIETFLALVYLSIATP